VPGGVAVDEAGLPMIWGKTDIDIRSCDEDDDTCESSSTSKAWLAHLDASGAVRSQTKSAELEGFGHVAADGAGNFVTISDDEIGARVTRLRPDGTEAWSKAFPTWHTTARFDAEGNLILVGTYAIFEDLDFGGGPIGPATDAITSEVWYYLAKLGPGGEHIFSVAYEPHLQPEGGDVAGAADGAIYGLFQFSGAFETDAGVAHAPPHAGDSLAVVRFAPDTFAP
jgi:hypothetical protein